MIRPSLRPVARPGTLAVVFQPILDVGSNQCRLHGLEALIRKNGLDSAGALFEEARRAGQECRLDRACVDTVLRAVAELPADLAVSLNVHASTLGCDRGFFDFVVESAERHGVRLPRLTIEIVEHTHPCDDRLFEATLGAFRARGARIALDDVGLGYSNFRMMLDCRPDLLKIDRYLVAGCHKDPRREAVVASVAALGARLGAQVVAEGIEEVADLVAVKALGIDLVQGFLLSRPVPARDLPRAWAAWAGGAQGPPAAFPPKG